MAFRFRKSIKIAPGIRVSIGKKGVSSVSLGPRGASVSLGKSGKYANVGIPGTGISFRSRIDSQDDERRIEREQRRLLKEQEKQEKLQRRIESLSNVKLNLNDNGSINIINSFGEPLTKSDMKLMWDQHSDTIHDWLSQEADKTNGDVKLLANIYQDAPEPNSEPVYQLVPFEKPKPKKPKKIKKPELKELPPLGFIAKLFKSKKQQYLEKTEELKQQYQFELEAWAKSELQKSQQYESDLKVWQNQKAEHDQNEYELQQNFSTLISTDIVFMENTLEDTINRLSWPRETLISYHIEKSNQEVWLDVDLPEIEDLPQKVASIAATGKKLNIKNKPKKQLQLEYAQHIHGIAFRLVSTIFATLPKTNIVVISGYSQRLDKATGKINDDYLFSFKVDRDNFSKIDFGALDNVDPVEAMGAFDNRRKMTATGIFKAIEPFTLNS